MTLNVIGLIPLIFIHNDTSILYIVFCLIILGFGFALFSSPNVNATMSAVGNKFYAAKAGLSPRRVTSGLPSAVTSPLTARLPPKPLTNSVVAVENTIGP